jgi:hypothetical protein
MNHCQIFSCNIFHKSQDLSKHWAYKGFHILLSDGSLWRWILLICQTLSVEVHERKIRTIWPLSSPRSFFLFGFIELQKFATTWKNFQRI